MDIVENLRGLSRGDNSDFSLGDEAAEEITRLRARVAELEAQLETNTRHTARAAMTEISRQGKELSQRVIEANAKIAELEAKLKEATEWRPIDSAPKDGTPILVLCRHGQYVVRWGEDGDANSEYAWWEVDENKNGPYPLRGEEPTHYLPLPAPPKDETK